MKHYTVKKIKMNETIIYPISAGRDCWAVVDETGTIHDLKHEKGHKLTGDIFDRKYIAQKQADYLNGRS